ncbi:pilus assembly protein TadE [Tabrizicola sp. TH137]|uniref:TadE/TadG family type IV pilus assembly protein n=1 Tax=Tabrizicola sp. TH137 TaxID=2067452 RepID=UPI000C7BC754|nr:TadE/TadG family type IV pilus assembly protein [Tabrizicola sp. TH137]PLL11126.1 pilus assembly protein TadE [Tabrizicola sp. TH137]
MRLSRLLKRFRRDERGNATIEFVILMPLCFTIFAAALESGLMMLRWTSIDRASDIVIRSLRLGQYENPDALMLRREICDRTFMIEDCFENTVVDIREINRATFLMPDADAPCVTRANEIIQPVVEVTPGQQNDLMLIRVCVTTDALFAGSTFAVPITYDAHGGYAISVASVYVNEPS